VEECGCLTVQLVTRFAFLVLGSVAGRVHAMCRHKYMRGARLLYAEQRQPSASWVIAFGELIRGVVSEKTLLTFAHGARAGVVLPAIMSRRRGIRQEGSRRGLTEA
jgi:hypothetical protein